MAKRGGGERGVWKIQHNHPVFKKKKNRERRELSEGQARRSRLGD